MDSEQPVSGSTGDQDLPEALVGLRWDNRYLDQLPVDPETDIRPRQVVGALSSRVRPVRASAPSLVAHSPEMAAELGLDEELWLEHRDLMGEILAGNRLLPGMDPHAAAYGGHQFGHWAGQLGDGRAMALGELVTPGGQHQTLQLKGAGPTPYSRGADGFAVLRSSVREFLCSEAMHHLGIPTTRALSLVLTGDKVIRDMFYDGNPHPEPGAVVCRVAPSFIRFGNFQLLAARQDLDLLRRLADFTVEHHFAAIGAEHPSGHPDRYTELYAEVARTSLEMVLGWMRVGFVHGVMNTDNMSILGLTIDYGPYGWLEDFDPGWTPNTTDAAHRRYRYGQQPQVVHWNLVQLANALVPLVGRPEPLQEVIEDFGTNLASGERRLWRAKCGLDPGVEADDTGVADELVAELFPLLTAAETDMTLFFRGLAQMLVEADRAGADHEPADRATLVAPLAPAYYHEAEWRAVAGRVGAWSGRLVDHLRSAGHPLVDRAAAMNRINPKYVLRNYLAQIAIDAAEGDDHTEIVELLDVLRRPYDEQPDRDRYAARRPEWARQRPGCSQLSCSS